MIINTRFATEGKEKGGRGIEMRIENNVNLNVYVNAYKSKKVTNQREFYAIEKSSSDEESSDAVEQSRTEKQNWDSMLRFITADSIALNNPVNGQVDNEKIVIDVGILNLNYDTTFYISEAGELICSDYGEGGRELWSRSLTEEQIQKCHDLMRDSYDFTAYMYERDFWDAYLEGEINIDMLKEFEEEIEEKVGDLSVFEGCMNEVKKAWMEAEKDIGINGFGLDEEGKMQYVSEYVRQMIANQMKREEQNILGDTVESALEFAKRAVDAIEDFLKMESSSIVFRQSKEREKSFYVKFMENLDDVL